MVLLQNFLVILEGDASELLEKTEMFQRYEGRWVIDKSLYGSFKIYLPWSQICPLHPAVHEHLPVAASHVPLFSHRQRSKHWDPKVPSGHSTCKAEIEIYIRL